MLSGAGRSQHDGLAARTQIRAPYDGVAVMTPAPHVHQNPDFGISEKLPDAQVLRFGGDELDLEPVLRDLIVTALPLAPVCRDDCPGLCSECGARLADDPTHKHDIIDARWAALLDVQAQEPEL